MSGDLRRSSGRQWSARPSFFARVREQAAAQADLVRHFEALAGLAED